MASAAEQIELEIEGQVVIVERLEDGTFRKPAYLAGAERDWYEVRRNGGGDSSNHINQLKGRKSGVKMESSPATAPAALWDGYGTAMKPAHEPILCFRNPKQGTYAENCTSTGAGALWIDGARVGNGEDKGQWPITDRKIFDPSHGWNNHQMVPPTTDNTQGRWPPNVVLQHVAPDADGNGGCVRVGTKRVRPGNGGGYQTKPTVDPQKSSIFGIGGKATRLSGYVDPDGLETVDEWQCVESCPARLLGEQSGELTSGAIVRDRERSGHILAGHAGKKKWTTRCEASTGTAARFFPQFSWQHEAAERSFDYAQDRLAGVTPFYYCAKSARRERDAGLEEMVEQVAGYRRNNKQPGIRTDARNPEWDTTVKPVKARNPHPTVKPISLVSDFLAKLLLPPPEYAPRRVLVPFAGSGSEMIGCLLAGFDEVVGIEMEPEYVEIAEARLRFWATWAGRGYDDPKAILKEAKKEAKKAEAQMELKL